MAHKRDACFVRHCEPLQAHFDLKRRRSKSKRLVKSALYDIFCKIPLLHGIHAALFFVVAKSYIYDISFVLNRKAEFDVLEQDVAEVAKALSHPARLSILKILAKQKGCMCGDIVDLLPLAQSTVSQHLKYLKEVGLIKGEVDGPKTCYCLNEEVIQQFKNNLNEIFTEIDLLSRNSDCC